MIIDNSNKVFESNMEPNKVMNFGISDVSLVMEVLSTLYKHSVQTLVQEYICNGRDAMREAGTWGKKAMIISVPNSFEPSFRVRDFGVGISPDRMSNIFVNYGSSTKRNTNSQTGGFGIGAKSAFSYTDSFTVTSYYNGVKYVYLCYMTKEKGGCDLLTSEVSNEENGVEISIAVKPQSITEFKNAIQRCVKYWQEPIKFEGIVDGEIKQESPISSIGQMDVYVNGDKNSIYLIDGVPYPLLSEGYYKYNVFSDASYGYDLVINIPNGYFKLSPSRENLIDNEDNKEKQKVLLESLKEKIQNKVAYINSLDSLDDKLSARTMYEGFSQINNMRIKLTDIVDLSGTSYNYSEKLGLKYLYKTRRGKESVKDVTYDRLDVNNTVIIKTNNDANMNNLSRRVNNYITKQGNTNKKYLVIDFDLPYEKALFKTIIDSTTLEKPVYVQGASKKARTHSGSIVYIRTEGGRYQDMLGTLNRSTNDCLLYDKDLPSELFSFFTVYEVPKCNESGVTKQFLTREEAHAKLIARRNEALGVNENLTKLDIFKQFKSMKYSDTKLKEYLLKYDAEFVKLQAELDKQVADATDKCPLIKILQSERYLAIENERTLIAEINKQLK